MITAEFSLENSQIKWLEQCQSFGFKDKSDLVRTAINKLYEQLKQQQSLRESAQLYAEIYETDEVSKTKTHNKRTFGSAKGKYQLAPDFDAPLF